MPFRCAPLGLEQVVKMLLDKGAEVNARVLDRIYHQGLRKTHLRNLTWTLILISLCKAPLIPWKSTETSL
jgi:hypothetical protein